VAKAIITIQSSTVYVRSTIHESADPTVSTVLNSNDDVWIRNQFVHYAVLLLYRTVLRTMSDYREQPYFLSGEQSPPDSHRTECLVLTVDYLDRRGGTTV
jgi:hypothetical protein